MERSTFSVQFVLPPHKTDRYPNHQHWPLYSMKDHQQPCQKELVLKCELENSHLQATDQLSFQMMILAQDPKSKEQETV